VSGVVTALGFSDMRTIQIAAFNVVTTEVYGFSTDFSQGSVQPNRYRGDTIGSLYTQLVDAPRDLVFGLTGFDQGQSFFTSLLVRDSTGAWRTYTSASATYDGVGGSTWFWGDGSNPVWTAAGQSLFRLIE
jgi:hypothetical protein